MLTVLLAGHAVSADSGGLDVASSESRASSVEPPAGSVAGSEEQAADSDSDVDQAVFQLPEILVEGKKISAPPSLIIRQVNVEDIRGQKCPYRG